MNLCDYSVEENVKKVGSYIGYSTLVPLPIIYW